MKWIDVKTYLSTTNTKYHTCSLESREANMYLLCKEFNPVHTPVGKDWFFTYSEMRKTFSRWFQRVLTNYNKLWDYSSSAVTSYHTEFVLQVEDSFPKLYMGHAVRWLQIEYLDIFSWEKYMLNLHNILRLRYGYHHHIIASAWDCYDCLIIFLTLNCRYYSWAYRLPWWNKYHCLFNTDVTMKLTIEKVLFLFAVNNN